MLRMHGQRQAGVRLRHTRVLQRILNDMLLQLIGKIGPLICQRARSILIARDRRPFPKKRMVVPRQRLRMFRHKKFRPVAHLVLRAHAERVARLREAGVDDEGLARVMAPIGLDIGARTPEETAVSICAEIIAQRTGRLAPSLRDADGPIHA